MVVILLTRARSAWAWRSLSRSFSARLRSVTSMTVPTDSMWSADGVRGGWPTPAVAQTRAFLRGPLALCDVDDGTNGFNVFAGWAESRMADHVDVPDGTAGVND